MLDWGREGTKEIKIIFISFNIIWFYIKAVIIPTYQNMTQVYPRIYICHCRYSRCRFFVFLLKQYRYFSFFHLCLCWLVLPSTKVFLDCDDSGDLTFDLLSFFRGSVLNDFSFWCWKSLWSYGTRCNFFELSYFFFDILPAIF